MKFKKRLAKIEAFKKDFKELLQKHNFDIEDVDDYRWNGEDEECVTSEHFVVGNEEWLDQSINQIIEECLECYNK